MSTPISLRFLGGLWLALLVALPCAAQDVLLQPADVRTHPASSLPVVNRASSPLFVTASALLADDVVWPFDGKVLRTHAAEKATGLVTVAPASDGGQSFRFYTTAPSVMWGLKHTRLLPPDTPGPVFTIGATGRVAYVLPATATLVLLDAQGEVVQEKALFKDAPYTFERKVLLATQPRTGNILIAAMRQPSHLADGGEQAVLFCYTPSGALLWKRALPLPSVHALSVDPHGHYIAVASAEVNGGNAPIFRTLFLDAEGSTLHTLSDGFARISWAETAAAALLISKQEVIWYDLASGQIRQRQSAPSRQQRWMDAVLSADGQQAILLAAKSGYANGGFEYQQGRLYSLDANGSLRAATAEEAPSTRLALVPGTDHFSLIRDDMTRQYRWENLR